MYLVKYNVKISPLPCKINLISDATHCFTLFIHPEQAYFPTFFPQKVHFSALMTYSAFILILRFASCPLPAAAVLLLLIIYLFFELRNISILKNFLANKLIFFIFGVPCFTDFIFLFCSHSSHSHSNISHKINSDSWSRNSGLRKRLF